MIITLLAAVGEDLSLGKDGKLLWKLSEDLRNFREITFGGVVMMGRKTWESLPHRPLPGRRNIVITRNQDYQAPGAEVYSSIPDSLDSLKKEGVDEVFIIGGGEIYNQSIGIADKILLTKVYQEYPDADTFFPMMGPEWKLFTESDLLEENNIRYQFQTYIR